MREAQGEPQVSASTQRPGVCCPGAGSCTMPGSAHTTSQPSQTVQHVCSKRPPGEVLLQPQHSPQVQMVGGLQKQGHARLGGDEVRLVAHPGMLPAVRAYHLLHNSLLWTAAPAKNTHCIQQLHGGLESAQCFPTTCPPRHRNCCHSKPGTAARRAAAHLIQQQHGGLDVQGARQGDAHAPAARKVLRRAPLRVQGRQEGVAGGVGEGREGGRRGLERAERVGLFHPGTPAVASRTW